MTIDILRRELGLNQDNFARKIGLSNKGSVSVIERGGPCSLQVALAIEELSRGADGVARIDAASLNDDVAAARARCECPVGHDLSDSASLLAPSTGQNRELSRGEQEAAI